MVLYLYDLQYFSIDEVSSLIWIRKLQFYVQDTGLPDLRNQTISNAKTQNMLYLYSHCLFMIFKTYKVIINKVEQFCVKTKDLATHNAYSTIKGIMFKT